MRDRVKKALLLLVVAVFLNIGLAVSKLYVGLSSNSLTIMLDGMNSFFDIITSCVTVVAFGVLLRPRGENAPHGYGRVEYLASFIVAVVSAVVGGIFFVRSLNRMAMPEPVWFGLESCILISIGIPLKLALGLVYHFANKKLKSKAIAAIELDSFLDAAITTASLISYVISSAVDYAVDAIFGMALSVVVVVFAIRMIVDSVRSITLGDDSSELRRRIEDAASAQPQVQRVREVSVHDYGYGEKLATVVVVMREGAELSDVDEARKGIADSLDELDDRPRIDLAPICAQLLDDGEAFENAEDNKNSDSAEDNKNFESDDDNKDSEIVDELEERPAGE